MIAPTLKTPYYAVIFTSIKSVNQDGYEEMSEKMMELAKEQKGFLGVESASSDLSITVSYWESLEAIRSWKTNSAHLTAQQLGKSKWYNNFKTRICLVQRDYEFNI